MERDELQIKATEPRKPIEVIIPLMQWEPPEPEYHVTVDYDSVELRAITRASDQNAHRLKSTLDDIVRTIRNAG